MKTDMPPKAEHMDHIGERGYCDECGDPLQSLNEGTHETVVCRACEAWGPPCLRCGERGTLPDGDESDCRSPSCLSDAADHAEYLMDPDR